MHALLNVTNLLSLLMTRLSMILSSMGIQGLLVLVITWRSLVAAVKEALENGLEAAGYKMGCCEGSRE